MPRARVNVIPTSAPDDVSGLLKLVETGEIDPSRLVAILGKTEGNGCVNDFTRGFAVSALKHALGANAADIALVMSGGTEGGLAPHMVTFEVLDEMQRAGVKANTYAYNALIRLFAFLVGDHMFA